MDPYQDKIFISVLIAASVLGIIIVYFITGIIRYHRAYLKAQHANLLVEINTLEQERRRIVSDLHDELGPLLSMVKLQLSGFEAKDAKEAALVEKAQENVNTIAGRIRAICNELTPVGLLRRGLIAAVREFIYELDLRSEKRFEFDCVGDVAVRHEMEIHLFRMIQEIVNNALKHSGAELIRVAMCLRNHTLTIRVNDNGRGFNVEKTRLGDGGFGLKNLMSRVNVLQGELFIDSSPGEGTTYTIHVPVNDS